MKQIPVQLLQSFVVFAEAKNIVAAAARLGITQPALSKQLRQLEAGMPGKIFLLQGRKKVLTPFGQDLYRRLQPRFANIGETVEEAWALHANAANACLRIAGRRGVLDRMAELGFPGSLHFQELANEAVVAAVTEGTAEIGIVHRLPSSARDLVAKPLFEEEFQLVIPKKLLPAKPALSRELFKLLAALPCLAYKPEDEVLDSVGRYFGLSAKLRLTRITESYASLTEMVEADLGWAVLPGYLKISKSTWLIPLPPKALPERKFQLIYRPEYVRVKWFKELVEEIKACFGGQ